MKATKESRKQVKEQPEAAVPAPAQEAESVDRIRDIIFGAQMRDYEARFRALEERLGREIDVIGQRLEKRFEQLSQETGQRLDRLKKDLQAEASQRNEANGQLAQALEHLDTSLRQNISEQGGSAGKALAEARDQLSKETRESAAGLGKRIDDLSRSLSRQFEKLGDEKTDRAALAALLTEVAGQLSAGPPGKNK